MKELYVGKILLKGHGVGAHGQIAEDLSISVDNLYQRLLVKSNCGYKFKEKFTVAYNMRFGGNYVSADLFKIVPKDFQIEDA